MAPSELEPAAERASSPVGGLSVRRASSSGLPEDFLTEARRRLAWACMLYAGAFVTAAFLPRWLGLYREMRAGADWVRTDWIAWLSIALAVGLAAAVHVRRLPTALLIDVALIFEVVGAFAIAVNEYWFVYTPEHVRLMLPYLHGISWVCLWLMAFPILVPTTLGKAILASLLAASSGPVILMLGYHYYEPAVAEAVVWNNAVGAAVGNLVAVAMATVLARVIWRLGRQVREARRLGSYHLVSRLGSGGMGEVWRGEHRLLARPAAVKLIRPDVLAGGSPDAAQRVVARFEREAQATAQLRSPHSVNLYDFGVADDGTFYYVMELLEGLTLQELVERFGPVPPERAVHLLRQVCASLREAHARGLVHRDIKPANIFCCRFGSEVDFVKVLDFGLVKDVGEGEPDAVGLTKEGAVAGTPAFMAPEAILREHVDARADLYALGCVAYWLLTGRLVFEAQNATRAALMHVQQPPQPPSARSESAIPEALDRLVLDCLAKEPEGRPRDAAEVRRRLIECPLAQPWTEERAQRWWALHLPSPRTGEAAQPLEPTEEATPRRTSPEA